MNYRVPESPPTHHCGHCDAVYAIPPDILASVIYDRGYWWCRKCAAIRKDRDGKSYIDWPSEGKLIPNTIMEQSK